MRKAPLSLIISMMHKVAQHSSPGGVRALESALRVPKQAFARVELLRTDRPSLNVRFSLLLHGEFFAVMLRDSEPRCTLLCVALKLLQLYPTLIDAPDAVRLAACR